MTYGPPLTPPPAPPPPPPAQPQQLAFHRLFRSSPKYRAWKPWVFALLAIVFGFTLTAFVSIVGMIPIIVGGGIEELLEFEQALLSLDTQNPLVLFIALASLAVWIPAIILAGWAVGFTPLGRLWSVENRLRWGLLARTILPAVLALVLMQSIAIGLDLVLGGSTFVAVEIPDFDVNAALISLVIVIVLVPFQATAEELMFRGALMQLLGSFLKNPIIPIIVPTALFALAHIYDIWGLMHVAAMGFVAAWLTWRTGGLEAAISIHVVNNYIAFGMLLSGVTGETAQTDQTGASPFSLVLELAALAFYAFLVVRIFNRGPWQRTQAVAV